MHKAVRGPWASPGPTQSARRRRRRARRLPIWWRTDPARAPPQRLSVHCQPDIQINLRGELFHHQQHFFWQNLTSTTFQDDLEEVWVLLQRNTLEKRKLLVVFRASKRAFERGTRPFTIGLCFCDECRSHPKNMTTVCIAHTTFRAAFQWASIDNFSRGFSESKTKCNPVPRYTNIISYGHCL